MQYTGIVNEIDNTIHNEMVIAEETLVATNTVTCMTNYVPLLKIKYEFISL
jgi:hypothetical protein